MGADLYIEPGATEWRAKHEPAFNAAVAARDGADVLKALAWDGRKLAY